jgi:hypothetical protein
MSHSSHAAASQSQPVNEATLPVQSWLSLLEQSVQAGCWTLDLTGQRLRMTNNLKVVAGAESSA